MQQDKRTAKYQYAAALATVVVIALSLAASAQKQGAAGRVFLLKSGGAALAELRVRAATNIAVESADFSGHSEYDPSTGRLFATGGAILKLTDGTNSISVRAGEIESVSGSK
jgi:hypothetical protein